MTFVGITSSLNEADTALRVVPSSEIEDQNATTGRLHHDEEIKMKTQTASLLLALTLAPLGAAQACDAPVAPPSPDGGSSTLEEMIAAQGEVKAFQAANADYLECVDNQMSAEQASIDEGDESAKERYALAAADYNAAVSREEQVAADFNAAIKAYKAANPD